MGKMNSYGLTHIGKVRNCNEDFFIVLPDKGLWIVADGMGGYEAGEIASKIAVNSVVKSVISGASLIEAIQNAHKEILKFSQKNKVPRMGCTIVVLKIQNNHYEIAWVGDSRAYKWNGKELTLLTKDHSLVQELIDSGSLTIEEARKHPHRNIVTRALGVNKTVKVDVTCGQLKEGDSFLLCTDGLTGEIGDHEIAKILSLGRSPKETCELLVNSVLNKNASDNITVVIVGQPTKGQQIKKGSTQKIKSIHFNEKRSFFQKTFRILLIAASLLIAIFSLFLFYIKNVNNVNSNKTSNIQIKFSKKNPSPSTSVLISLDDIFQKNKTFDYECKIIADNIFAELAQNQEPKEKTVVNLKKCLLKNRKNAYLRNAYLKVYNAYLSKLKLNLKKDETKVIVYKTKINELLEFDKKQNLNILDTSKCNSIQKYLFE